MNIVGKVFESSCGYHYFSPWWTQRPSCTRDSHPIPYRECCCKVLSIAFLILETNIFSRPGQIDAYDNEDFRNAVKATGKKQLILAGIVTDVCVAFAALSLIEAGYDVFVVSDCSGTYYHILWKSRNRIDKWGGGGGGGRFRLVQIEKYSISNSFQEPSLLILHLLLMQECRKLALRSSISLLLLVSWCGTGDTICLGLPPTSPGWYRSTKPSLTSTLLLAKNEYVGIDCIYL